MAENLCIKMGGGGNVKQLYYGWKAAYPSYQTIYTFTESYSRVLVYVSAARKSGTTISDAMINNYMLGDVTAESKTQIQTAAGTYNTVATRAHVVELKGVTGGSIKTYGSNDEAVSVLVLAM